MIVNDVAEKFIMRIKIKRGKTSVVKSPDATMPTIDIIPSCEHAALASNVPLPPLRPRAMFLIFEGSYWWQHRRPRDASEVSDCRSTVKESCGGETFRVKQGQWDNLD